MMGTRVVVLAAVVGSWCYVMQATVVLGQRPPTVVLVVRGRARAPLAPRGRRG